MRQKSIVSGLAIVLALVLVLALAGTATAGKLSYVGKDAPEVLYITWTAETITVYFDTYAGKPTQVFVEWDDDSNHLTLTNALVKVTRSDLAAGYVTITAHALTPVQYVRGYASNRYGTDWWFSTGW